MFESRIGLEREDLEELKRLLQEDKDPARARIIHAITHQLEIKIKRNDPSVSMDDDIIKELSAVLTKLREEERTVGHMLKITELLKRKEGHLPTGKSEHAGKKDEFVVDPSLLKFEIKTKNGYRCDGDLKISYAENVWEFFISTVVLIEKDKKNDHGSYYCTFLNVEWQDDSIFHEEPLSKLANFIGKDEIEWTDFAKCLPKDFLKIIMREFQELYGRGNECDDCN
jgi:hypothetical protein